MNLENICISLALAKKLKEIGIEQDSLFYWKNFNNQWHIDFCDKPLEEFKDKWCSAFTAQELWTKVKDCFFTLTKDQDGTLLYYQPEWGTDNSYTFTGEKIANLLAEMLIAQDRERKYAK